MSTIMTSLEATAQLDPSRRREPGRAPETSARRRAAGWALRTDGSAAPLVLRVALGLVMFPHGAQHALGWFGGYGFSGTLGWMTGTLGFPAALAALAIVTELLAPLALIVGLGGRLAAAGIAGIMVGAIPTHWSSGFFMNWYGQLPAGAEGFEYHLLALAMAVAVGIAGSGRWSLDRRLAGRVAGRV